MENQQIDQLNKATNIDILTITYNDNAPVVITEVHAWMAFSAVSWLVFLLTLLLITSRKKSV